ncbi:CBU_0592 family membrane protein [Curtobacterium caseinilyticum]|uniref:CBU-0592-like domain-containing protein n=1 Tax=Curtobacterium caseinilyticum TaxID=3055137 RepID=A0ABT7TQ59_9MICO|nr:hypothetical protein [Curtobacterium caseinilyticum]MDM7891723.1 hypothetical protein [Curtobacterium caseinilyticum]
MVGIVEFLGWFGAVTVLAGYLLFSLGKIPNGPLYQSLNLVGGLSVAINVAAHHAVPSTIVNGVWAVIAVVVLVRMARARHAAGVRAAEPEETVAPPVLHAEPLATTAVLPVVGPALRDHEAEASGAAPAAPRLQAGPVPEAGTGALRADADAAPTAHGRADAAPTAHGRTDAAAAPAAPMTESVPVITATIALALVAAAQQHVGTVTQEHTTVGHAADGTDEHAGSVAQRDDATQ